MGKEDQNGGSPPAEPPAEEPPKMEEIVTPEVLQQIVIGYNPDLSLKSWKAELGSKVGDNYMSVLYSVELELEDKKSGGATETLHVMLKTLPTNSFRAFEITEMKAFTKEALIYKDVIPVLIKMQEEREVPKEELFCAWPKCYAVHLDGKSDYLAMENLRVSGYTMGNRESGLDFNHCSIVMRTLAKYHAISYVKFGGSREKILEAFPTIKCGAFNKESKVSDMHSQFFTQTYKTMAKSLEELGEKVAASRLEKLSEVDPVLLLGGLTMDNIEHAVITHGDFWVNNMMFKYSENDAKTICPVSVKLIDFQLCQASSRLVDFYYFLTTSTKIDIMNTREMDLLMIYYSEFTSYAERLGMNTKENGLTWENLLKEADRFRLYGVCMGLLLAPMMMADAGDIPDLDSYTQEDFENNADETAKKFFESISSTKALEKAKCLVLDHMPNCENAEQFL